MSNTGFSLLQFYSQVKSKVNFTDTTPGLSAFHVTDSNGISTEKMRLTSNGIGIGVATPFYPLDIAGDTQIRSNLFVQQSAHILSNAAVYKNLSIGHSGPTQRLDVDGSGLLRGHLYVNSNIGIGTSNPTSKLHIYNGDMFMQKSDATCNCTFTVQNGIGALMSMELQKSDGIRIGTVGVSNKVTDTLWINRTGGVGINNSNPAYTLDVTGNTRTSCNMYVMSNLGIGTTNPTSKLEIANGNVVLDAFGTTKAGLYFRKGYDTPTSAYNVSVTNFDWRDPSTSNGTTTDGLMLAGHYGVGITTSNSAGYNPALIRMFVTHTGLVGINTTAPSYNLDVNGTTQVRSNLYTLGNIGIGTTNPSYPLHVASGNGLVNNTNIGAIAGNSWYAGFCHSNFTNSNACYAVIQDGSSGNLLVNAALPTSRIQFCNSNNFIASFNTSGLGIGTNASTALHIAHNGSVASGIGAVYIRSSDVNCNNTITFANAGSSFMAIEMQKNDGVRIGTFASGKYSDTFWVNRAGGVGINNSNPGYAFDVTGDAQVKNNMYVLGNIGCGTVSPLYKLDVTGTPAAARISAGNNVTIFAQYGVGIGGPTNPLGKLHMGNENYPNSNNIVFEAGNIAAGGNWAANVGWSAMNFNGYTTTSNVQLNANKNRWRMVVDQRSTNDTMFIDTYNGTTTTTPLSITKAGFIGLGTSTPMSHLHMANPLYPLSNNIVFEVGSSANNLGSVGFSAINFNGYTGSEHTRIATNKMRWRMVCDQQLTRDNFLIDAFDGTTMSTRFIILSNGNVGIGTDTPAYKLSVNGNVQTNGVNLSGTSWGIYTGDENSTAFDGSGILTLAGTLGPVTSATRIRAPAASWGGVIFEGNDNKAKASISTSTGNIYTIGGLFPGKRMNAARIEGAGQGSNNGIDFDGINASTSSSGIYFGRASVASSDWLGLSNSCSNFAITNALRVRLQGADTAGMIFENAANRPLMSISGSSGFVTINSNLGIGLSGSATYQLQLSADSAAKPSSTSWTVSSDERLKEDIQAADLDVCYNAVKNLPLKYYKWRDDVYTQDEVPDRHKLGWIAQDVQSSIPKAVSVMESAYGLSNVLALNADQIYAMMYGTVQKLQLEIETLKSTNSALLARLDNLESHVYS